MPSFFSFNLWHIQILLKNLTKNTSWTSRSWPQTFSYRKPAYQRHLNKEFQLLYSQWHQIFFVVAFTKLSWHLVLDGKIRICWYLALYLLESKFLKMGLSRLQNMKILKLIFQVRQLIHWVNSEMRKAYLHTWVLKFGAMTKPCILTYTGVTLKGTLLKQRRMSAF